MTSNTDTNESLNELNLALSQIKFEPPVFRAYFYYDPVTKKGTRISGELSDEPCVEITQEEYDAMGVAFKYYVKDGQVKPIPHVVENQLQLEPNNNGLYRTLKDCIIFADPDGPDRYQKAEPKYD